MSKSKIELQISEKKYKANREIERSSKIFMRELTKLENPQRGKLLDIGCGTGLNAENLRQMGFEVSGVDLSPAAISQFNSRGFRGLIHDISDGLPYDDKQFDVVYASEVIEHLVDTNHFLIECSRVLKDGGTLILSTPNSSFWVYRVFAIIGKTLSEVQHPGHIRYFTLKSLTSYFVSTSLKIEKICARNMYLILPYTIGNILNKILSGKIVRKEKRFKTGKFYWHISSCSTKASSFFTDTMIIVARKKFKTIQ